MLYAKVNNSLQFDFENYLIQKNSLAPIIGKRVKIEIVESKKARSLGWNAYYWKIVVPNGVKAARGNGWEFSTDEMHEQFKKAFIIPKIKTNTKTGKTKKMLPSTSVLSNEEFEQFCIKCNQFTYEQSGVYVPLPEELKKGVKTIDQK